MTGIDDKNDEEKGLYDKYTVQRLNDPTGKHADCQYYVLDLHHDKFSVQALEAYAQACRDEFPILAFDLRHTAAATARRLNYAPPSAKNAVVPERVMELLRGALFAMPRGASHTMDLADAIYALEQLSHEKPRGECHDAAERGEGCFRAVKAERELAEANDEIEKTRLELADANSDISGLMVRLSAKPVSSTRPLKECCGLAGMAQGQCGDCPHAPMTARERELMAEVERLRGKILTMPPDMGDEDEVSSAIEPSLTERNLAMAVRRLAARLNRRSNREPDRAMVAAMLDLLKRYGLEGSPLRDDEPRLEQSASSDGGGA